MTLRSLCVAVLLSVAVLPAHAQAQAGPQEAAAAAALSALSERYAQLWSALPASERSRLAQAERQWLHVTRWQEQRACESGTAAGGAAAGAVAAVALSPEERAAQCLAQVTERHLARLPRPGLAAR